MNAYRRYFKFLSIVVSLFLLAACRTAIPREALQLTRESMRSRQLQTRNFETSDEKRILSACAALLQDLGFTIEESETKLGVLTGSKMRSAVDASQIAGAVIFTLLLGVFLPVERDQLMRVCVVTRPAEPGRHTVRVTFQRIVFDMGGHVCRREMITDPKVYEDFFLKLSKSVFLEAHGV